MRVTSPEPETLNGHEPSPPREETRKTSGGFFAKRFGVIKMKDHRSQKVIETSHNGGDSPAMDFKPLKVPAVFRLLRPEFREQLKQSSCIQNKTERIIPIRRENGGDKTNGKSPSVTPERSVPITKNGSATLNNNNNSSKTAPASSERVIPIRRESGDINSTPKRPVGFAPKVNGFSPSKTSNGSSSEDKPEASSKPSIVRKLSPLSPKHIVVTSNIGEKPPPPTKPDHLKSPPMSPEPRSVSGSPLGQSPTPPSSSSSVPDPDEPKVGKPVEPVAPPTQPDSEDKMLLDCDTGPGRHLGEMEQNGVSETRNGVTEGPCTVTSSQSEHRILSADQSEAEVVNTKVINNNQVQDKEEYEQEVQDNPDEYPEEYFYDNPAPPCGLRERELLCPIMEEDNESTASGSIVNLAPSHNGSVIGETSHIATTFGEILTSPSPFRVQIIKKWAIFDWTAVTKIAMLINCKSLVSWL